MIYGKCQYQPREGRCTRKMEGGKEVEEEEGERGMERGRKRTGWREKEGIVREY